MRFARLFVAFSLAFLLVPVSITHAASCRSGGNCAVGDIGPGGGVVVHVSVGAQWWGSVIEARPLNTGVGLPWSLQPMVSLYVDHESGSALRQRIAARGMGMGGVNTAALIAQNGVGDYAASFVDALIIGGKSDWYLPSRDELDAAYHMATIGKWPTLNRSAYWTSSENNANFAWYQMFQDGTQFTDQSGVGRVNNVPILGNKNATSNSKHGMSGFLPLPFRLMAVRAFGSRSGTQPIPFQPKLTGNVCSDTGPCSVGDTGPGGGVVFYDAGAHQTWGRYLEAAPSSSEVAGLPWKKISVIDRSRPLYRDDKKSSARIKRVTSKLMGMGQINTSALIKNYGPGSYAAQYADMLEINGKSDWFLPSEDELEQMYLMMQSADVPIDPLRKSFYWSSSEYDYDNAWTVNFKDGQQFDRFKNTVASPSIKAIRVRAVRAFG